MSRADTELIEEQSPQQAVMDAAAKVLRAGAWLIRNGYGRMSLLPYAAPSGCAWRCQFHLPGRPSKTFYRYSTSSEAKYLQNHCGGSIRRTISPRALARAIMKSVPDDQKDACRGKAAPETLRWLDQLDAVLDAGFLPQAFHEYTGDYSSWELVSLTHGKGAPIPPQPGYVEPGSERSVVDLEWRAGEAAWKEIARNGRATIDLAVLSDDERCYDLAARVRCAFETAIDGFDSMRLLRAIVGELSGHVDGQRADCPPNSHKSIIHNASRL